MKTSPLKDKQVWITGASSGIGLEMSLLAAEAGAHLTLFSSQQDKLADAAQLCAAAGAASVRHEVIDLSNAEKAQKASAALLEGAPPPYYLILNAGVSQRAKAMETSLETARKIIDLNFFGAVAVSQAVLPAMAASGGGRIGYTSSFVGVFGFPMRSSYSASKHALHGYFESVALEYAEANIKCTAAIPGFIKTAVSVNALSGDGSRHGKMDGNQDKGMEPRKCAEQYWKAVINGRWDIVIGGIDKIMVFFYRRLRFVYRILGRRVSPTGNDD